MALLGLALVANLIEIPLRGFKFLRDEDETNEAIKYKKAHGYDTTELEEKLDLLSKPPLDRFARRALKKRIKLGYEDSNERDL